MIILHENSHILSAEYEDTEQVHKTQRKRKDMKSLEQPRIDDRDEGVEIVQIEDERETSEIVEQDINKEQQETMEEIIIVERDKKGKLKQKRKESLEAEIEVEQEEEEEEEEIIKKTRKALKPKRPKVGEDELELEEIEEFQVISDNSITSVAVNIPHQINEVVPLNRSTEQAPGKPYDKKAKITLDTVNAITEQYLPTHESEIDQVQHIQPDKRKASVSILPMEPYSITETTIQGGIDEFLGAFKPTTVAATSALVPSESLQVSEILPNEAKPTDLKTSLHEASGRAEITMTLQEATTISETTVNQKEVPTEDFISPNTVKAEDSYLPQMGITVYEVQEGQVEDKLEPLKTISNKPRVNITPMEPVVIEEVHPQDKPGKYYPESIVPTEVASTTIISQRQRVTEEMHAPEKEGTYIPGRLPTGQTALVEVSYSGETAITSEQPVQEREGIFSPDRKVDTFEAQPNVNLLESITISTVDSQHQESVLTVEESKHVTADLNLIEVSSIVTTETLVTEKEHPYQTTEQPLPKSADTIISPLEIGSVTSTLVQESEGEYTGTLKPTAALAETSYRPEESLKVTQVQTADYPSDFSDDLKFVTESGTIQVHTTEAKEVREVLVHDRENQLEDVQQPEERTVETIYDSIKGIEVFQTTSVEKEGDLRIYELPESHRGKTVPTHPVLSLQIEEVTSHDTVSQIPKDTPLTAVAKIERDDLRETIIDETIPHESLIPVKETPTPETKTADVDLNEMSSIHTSEVIVSEQETEYTQIVDKQAYASTEFTTQLAPMHQEVRTESPTGEYVPTDLQKGIAQPSHTLLESISVGIHELAEKENIYTEDIRPSGKIASVELTETRPGAVTLEIVASDRENLYSPEKRDQPDVTAQPLVDAHPTAIKSETITEYTTENIVADQPQTNKAFTRQDAMDELIITETNIAEAEREWNEEMKPQEHSADVDLQISENLSVNQLITVLNRVGTS